MDHRIVTLFDVVETVQENAGTDREAVAVLTHLLKTRRVRFARSHEPQA